jgi:alpha-L-fucosidase 2
MKITRREFVTTVPLVAAAVKATASASPLPFVTEERNPWRLWYQQPAERWLDSLPLGNGRIGAMVFGGVQQEVFALNESTVWSGSPNSSNVNPTAQMHLARARQLIFEGKYAEANTFCNQYLSGSEGSYGTHLPLAKLKIDQNYAGRPDISAYHRSLDLLMRCPTSNLLLLESALREKRSSPTPIKF